MSLPRFTSLVLLAILSCTAASEAAQPPPVLPSPPPDAQPAPGPPPGASGTVLFSRDLNSSGQSAPKPADPASQPGSLLPGKPDPLGVTEAERFALTFTSYQLDLHATPATSALSARASVTVRNDSTAPLTRLLLQVSSALHWDGISLASPREPIAKLTFTSRMVATDLDHTGWVSEAVVPLPHPLGPGASLSLVVVYSGAVPPSAERLQRLDAPDSEAQSADWDAINSPDPDNPAIIPIALRGFGNVLWYPVSAPIVFLGDGARLFQLAGTTRLREQSAAAGLRLTVEFAGDPPDAAFFCGRVSTFQVLYDNPDAPVASGTGVATATFPAQPLGFRALSLFVTGHPATSAGTPSDPDLIAAVTDNFDALKSYSAAAAEVTPLLSKWLGKDPLTPLHLLDHAGEPFEDGALLVAPVSPHLSDAGRAALAGSLAHSLTHAWIHSAHPWIDEGLAQFMGLLWVEQTAGRPAALDQLQDSARALALAEPAPSTPTPTGESASSPPPSGSSSSSSSSGVPSEAPQPPAGQPLVNAASEVYYRTKAAAVWWMLRSYAGDDSLKTALKDFRQDPSLDSSPDGLERTLERVSRQDLRWFFEDWVYHDRGLPDLTVVNVTPRELEVHNGHGGWLVSIEVRNDGDAVADVPVTLRSAPGSTGASAASETQRLRIPGHSTVSRRIVFPVPPSEVQVNDGSVPETRVSIHTEHIPAPTG